LDRVSTGSGTDLVSESACNNSLRILDSHGSTRSLSLPVLTRSKCDSYFWGKARLARFLLTGQRWWLDLDKLQTPNRSKGLGVFFWGRGLPRTWWAADFLQPEPRRHSHRTV